MLHQASTNNKVGAPCNCKKACEAVILAVATASRAVFSVPPIAQRLSVIGLSYHCYRETRILSDNAIVDTTVSPSIQGEKLPTDLPGSQTLDGSRTSFQGANRATSLGTGQKSCEPAGQSSSQNRKFA